MDTVNQIKYEGTRHSNGSSHSLGTLAKTLFQFPPLLNFHLLTSTLSHSIFIYRYLTTYCGSWFDSIAPGLPAHVVSPYSYAAQHSRNNSIVNLVTVAELTADKSIKVQHQVSFNLLSPSQYTTSWLSLKLSL